MSRSLVDVGRWTDGERAAAAQLAMNMLRWAAWRGRVRSLPRRSKACSDAPSGCRVNPEIISHLDATLPERGLDPRTFYSRWARYRDAVALDILGQVCGGLTATRGGRCRGPGLSWSARCVIC
jgi:hypothetical protein